MYEKSKLVGTDSPARRTAWKSPGIRRMAAGQAETAFSMASDGATQNS